MTSISTKSFGLALALMLAAFSAGARADATFVFTLSGQQDFQECTNPPSCTLDLVLPWMGKLTVVLDSGADGEYTNLDLVSFDLVSNLDSFHEPIWSPIPFIARFTVADGKLTSIGAAYYYPLEPDDVTTFGGMEVYEEHPLIYFTPAVTGLATLTPVPELGSWAMLLCGLALTVSAVRAPRRDRASRQSRLD